MTAGKIEKYEITWKNEKYEITWKKKWDNLIIINEKYKW